MVFFHAFVPLLVDASFLGVRASRPVEKRTWVGDRNSRDGFVITNSSPACFVPFTHRGMLRMEISS